MAADMRLRPCLLAPTRDEEKGVAPDPDSPEWREKVRLRRRADFWFCTGRAVTLIGVALQTAGSILPLDP